MINNTEFSYYEINIFATVDIKIALKYGADRNFSCLNVDQLVDGT